MSKDESMISLETAVDNLIASAMQVKAERDELLAACLAAIEACGPSVMWNGKTQRFLQMMERALERIDLVALTAAQIEATR